MSKRRRPFWPWSTGAPGTPTEETTLGDDEDSPLEVPLLPPQDHGTDADEVKVENEHGGDRGTGSGREVEGSARRAGSGAVAVAPVMTQPHPASSPPSSVCDHGHGAGEGPTAYRLYKYRFLELGLYCLGAALNQVAWISLQPISGAVENAYGIGDAQMAAIGYVYMATYLLVNFPSNYVLDRGGLRIGVLSGVALTSLGMSVKTLINVDVRYVYIGQTLAAMGQAFLLCAPAKLSALWFGPNERVVATTVATAFQPVGVAVGFVLPSLFVTEDDADPGNVEGARVHVYRSLSLQAGMAAVVLVLCLLFFREEPPSPPSSSGGGRFGGGGTTEEDDDEEDGDGGEAGKGLLADIRSAVSDGNFLLLCLCFGAVGSITGTYGNLLGIVADLYGYGPADASLFGSCFIVGGILGGAVFGTVVEARKNYRRVTTILCLMTAASPLALLVTLPTTRAWSVAMAASLLGFSAVPILPVGIDFGVELTYPVAEAVSSGLLICTSQVLGIALAVASGWLMSSYGRGGCVAAQLLYASFAAAAAGASLFVREDLKRLGEEAKLRGEGGVGAGEDDGPAGIEGQPFLAGGDGVGYEMAAQCEGTVDPASDLDGSTLL